MTIRRNLTGPEKRQIAAEGEWKCGICQELLWSDFEIDHKIPLWKGGNDSRDNMWALHAHCHSRKTENETIERLQRNNVTRRLKMLTCSRCRASVSPYFLHKCS